MRWKLDHFWGVLGLLCGMMCLVSPIMHLYAVLYIAGYLHNPEGASIVQVFIATSLLVISFLFSIVLSIKNWENLTELKNFQKLFYLPFEDKLKLLKLR